MIQLIWTSLLGLSGGHWPARCSQERMSNQVHQLNQLSQLHLILCYWFDKWLFKSNPWQSNKLNQILDSIDFKFISGAPGWPVVDQRAPGAMFKSIKSIESMKSIESNNIAAAGAVDRELGGIYRKKWKFENSIFEILKIWNFKIWKFEI